MICNWLRVMSSVARVDRVHGCTWPGLDCVRVSLRFCFIQGASALNETLVAEAGAGAHCRMPVRGRALVGYCAGAEEAAGRTHALRRPTALATHRLVVRHHTAPRRIAAPPRGTACPTVFTFYSQFIINTYLIK